MKIKEFIPLKYDFMFKEVFGREENLHITTYYLAKYFKMDYEYLKGKVKLLSKDLKLENKKSKRNAVVLLLLLPEKIVNVELNVSNYEYLRERNLIYLYKIHSGQLDSGDNYLNIKETIQINYDMFSIDKSKKRRRIYELRDEDEKLV